MAKSLYEHYLDLTPEERADYLARTPDEVVEGMARREWWFLARPEQREPEGDWQVWLILAGRGFGKTRACSEWLAEQVLSNPHAPDGTPTEWAIIAETFGDTRNVCVEGPSGILRAFEHRGLAKGKDYSYNRSAWQIVLAGGQRIHMLGADNPDAGRGFNLAGIWADEIAKWRYPYETWFEGIAPALRIGKNPRAVVATTPKPTKLLIDWTKRSDGSVYVTRGSTFDNAANLSAAALTEIRARYEGTRLGRQEIYGEVLEDIEGALWSLSMIEAARVDEPPALRRVVVAVDPSGGSSSESDEQGIVVAGEGVDGQYYVLADRTVRLSPAGWAQAAIAAFREYGADRIVAERNFGGDMVESTIRQVDPNVPIRMVNASRGKQQRAEPIAALYEQGRVHHVGVYEEMEEQMVSWTPNASNSPDRMDALVWALTELASGGSASAWINYMSNQTVLPEEPPVAEDRESHRQAAFQGGRWTE